MAATETALINGPAGRIELIIDTPERVRGIALVCHPHPLFHGANTNKVAHTLARIFRDLGYAALRPNFRGVGKSEGTHDHGVAETDDMLAVISWAQSRWGGLPLALGGFSFGAYVTTLAAALLEGDARASRLLLVGPSTQRALPADVPPDTVVIHGEADDVVPLSATMDWARPQQLPVIVMPGTGHFFHGQLTQLRDLIVRSWR